MTGILKVDQIQNIEDESSVKVNRTTSDGNIIELQKDGTTVGSIANEGTRFQLFQDTGGGFSLNSGGHAEPMNNGSRADNTMNLGGASYRFADLYLGGNIYIGGTGSANALDDYEEGTWTATVDFSSGSTGSLNYTRNTGRYVKVGKSVFVTAFIIWTANNYTASNGELAIKGLPFTTSSNGDYRGGVSMTYSSNPWTGVTVYQQAFRTEANKTELRLNFSDGTDGSMNSSIINHTKIFGSGSFMISGTYVVD